MLVLSRKNGESIVIDSSITIQVIEVKGHIVRLGIAAPKEIPIHRSEIFRPTSRERNDSCSPSEEGETQEQKRAT